VRERERDRERGDGNGTCFIVIEAQPGPKSEVRKAYGSAPYFSFLSCLPIICVWFSLGYLALVSRDYPVHSRSGPDRASEIHNIMYAKQNVDFFLNT
jgi:hypothetical protein